MTSSFSKGKYTRASLGTTLFYKGEKLNLSGDFTASDDNTQDDLVDVKKQSGFIFDQKPTSIPKTNSLL
ncbi:MAG: hypothetical protein IPL23_26680 [Saprospiraceae bacterium]|nr:hypothetical protein [Saprospiraceae bacterium]